jgi:hypothetical protein
MSSSEDEDIVIHTTPKPPGTPEFTARAVIVAMFVADLFYTSPGHLL